MIYNFRNNHHFRYNGDSLAEEIMGMKSALIRANPLPTSTWQSQEASKHPEMAPLEIPNAIIEIDIPEFDSELQYLVRPNLPWAEDHFQERISGKPLNPPPSSAWWPYAQADNGEHKEGQLFSHTYPERFWPKQAGQVQYYRDEQYGNQGLRYSLGDLQDVVKQLVNDPYTRQAYLPVFFPEDTGATSNQRVPCSLGYHFTIRPGRDDWGPRQLLHVNYFMRSCDIMRHMVDDLYMAARLGQWMRDQVELVGEYAEREIPGLGMGTLTMFMSSLHLFVGDIPIVRAQQKQWQRKPRGFSHAKQAQS
jgi:thymidylate synthase